MNFEDKRYVAELKNTETALAELRGQLQPALDRFQAFKANFGLRETSDGSIIIDFDKFAEALRMEQALELCRIVDEKYGITGAAGEKPRIRVPGKAAA